MKSTDLIVWLEPPKPYGQLRACRIKDEAAEKWLKANSFPLVDLLVDCPDNILSEVSTLRKDLCNPDSQLRQFNCGLKE